MTARPEPCPLCFSPDAALLHSSREKSMERDFLLCPECDLVFVPGRFHIGANAERERYLTHNNDPEDEDYRDFLDRLLSPLQLHLSAGASGLDYGAGPGPALLMMLRERGFDANMYDPLFHPDPAALERTYDFVTCTETLEHFASPRKELDTFQTLLKASSWLGVMTGMLETWDGFPDWYYHRDPTHISFYSWKTMAWIGRRYRWDALFPCQNVVLFHKSVSGTAAELLGRDHRH
jgi:hypothetical protein